MAASTENLTSVTYQMRSSTAIDAPAGIQDDDILVAVLLTFQATTVSAPDGDWSSFSNLPSQHDGDVECAAFWKRASSESGNYTFTHAQEKTEGLIIVCRGIDTTGSPENAATTFNKGSLTTSIDATGLSTDVTGCLLLHVYWAFDGGTVTKPSGWDVVEHDGTILALCSYVWGSSGATGTVTATNSATESEYGASLIALTPDAGGPAGLGIPIAMHHYKQMMGAN